MLATLTRPSRPEDVSEPRGLASDVGAEVRTQRRQRRRRGALTIAVLVSAVAALFIAAMMIGSYALWPSDVIASLLGLSGDPAVDFVVRDLRLPRAFTALGVGLALGLSGVIFQKLLANPLASPDFVGITSGASLAAVSGIVLLGLGGFALSGFALMGALVAAGLIYALAWRDGITGYRFILIGVGVSQFMLSLIGYVLVRADLYDARSAMTWLVGSVGQTGAAQLRVLAVVVLFLLPVTFLLGRHLSALELGDDTARGLGTRIEVVRGALLGAAIGLVAVAVAAVGPLMFVALLAGPIALRLLGSAPGALVATASVGAIIVLGADLAAQHVLPAALPTGVVTGAIGAPYLMWLLATVNKEGRGG